MAGCVRLCVVVGSDGIAVVVVVASSGSTGVVLVAGSGGIIVSVVLSLCIMMYVCVFVVHANILPPFLDFPASVIPVSRLVKYRREYPRILQ